MSKPSDDNPDRTEIRTKIMGLGERAGRKSYYPQLQARIQELEENKAYLEEKSKALSVMLGQLDGARREAEESEKRFRVLFEHLSDGIVVADMQTKRFVMGNESICRMLGYARSELPSRSFDDLHPSGDLPLIGDGSESCFRGEAEPPVEVPVRRRDGSSFWAEIRTTRLDLDGRPSLMGIFRDITERKRAEDELRRSELRFRELAELLPQTVFETDLTGRLTFVNRLGFEMFGYTPEDIQLGLDCIDSLVLEDRDRARADMERGLQGEDLPGQQYTALRKDGGTFPCIVYTTAIRDETGVTGLRGIVVDITDQVRLKEQKDLIEEQYHQAQKMEAVGRLAGGVAHDFNNLLCPILGYSEMLVSGFSRGDARLPSVEAIQCAGLKARELVRQLLAFSRKQPLEVKVVNLNTVVSAFDALLRRMLREDIEIRMALSPEVLSVRADVGQIEQVIMNLAVNAQDAMPGGGHISIETGLADLDDTFTADHHDVQPGPYVMLVLSDTGHGMDTKTRERIFDPFFTTKEKGKGTGLGLATVYGIVKQHGGSIWVYSELSKGSTFKIYLPLADEAVADSDASSRMLTDSHGTETVLLAEDSDMVRNLAVRILERQGYTVLPGASGTECLGLLDNYESPVDLLITDVIMPDMNGKALFQQVAARRPGIKVLYMSGYTEDVIVHHGVLDEGIAFLQKPFTVQGLTAKVREALETAG